MNILKIWNSLRPEILRPTLFSRILHQVVPYTGTTSPHILELKPGYAKVRVKDHRRVRNHLRSIHAAALMNVAEAASGLAFVAGLPENARAILKSFTIDYTKKARGSIYAEAFTPVLAEVTENKDYVVESIVKDESGEIVAHAHATWLVGPQPKTKS